MDLELRRARRATDDVLADPSVKDAPQVLRAAQQVRAGALQATGDVDSAIVLLEALTVTTAGAHHDQGDAGQAMRTCMRALEGRIAFADGDHDRARSLFQAGVHALTAAGADRDAAQLWFELADLLAEVGDHEGALATFRGAGASTGLLPRSPASATNP